MRDLIEFLVTLPFSGDARSNLTTSLFCLSNFLLFPFVVVVVVSVWCNFYFVGCHDKIQTICESNITTPMTVLTWNRNTLKCA